MPRHVANGDAVTFAVIAGAVLAGACASSGIRMTQSSPVPAAADIETTIFFVGDAGGPNPGGEPVFEALATDAMGRDWRRIVLFLGDNVYPRGLPLFEDADRLDAERRLAAQIAIAGATGSEAIFIPGNHDWDFAGEGRRVRLERAVEYGRTVDAENVTFLPRESCPGPEMLDVGEHIRLIILDTQWWLFPDPVEDVPPNCTHRSREAVLSAMRQMLDTAGPREVIIAAHHPLTTHGPHGGYFTLRQHLFPLTDRWKWAWIPLPIIGSVYPIARRSGITDQDLSGRLNRRMREAFEEVFRDYEPLLYVAGHEHSLQVSTGTAARYHVVSGSGNYGHTSPVRYGAGTLFAASESGYVRLDVQRDGHMRLGVMAVDADGGRHEVFATILE